MSMKKKEEGAERKGKEKENTNREGPKPGLQDLTRIMMIKKKGGICCKQ